MRAQVHSATDAERATGSASVIVGLHESGCHSVEIATDSVDLATVTDFFY